MKKEDKTMFSPDCNTILTLANDYPVVPVSREIYADVVTPITLLRRLQTLSSRFSYWNQ